MTKLLTSLLFLTTSTPILAAMSPDQDDATQIVIEVAAEDLERCRETLAQVMMSPLEANQPLPANMPATPNVACVVKR